MKVGWDDFYRLSRWNPVYVTVSTKVPREVSIELTAPQDNRFAMVIGKFYGGAGAYYGADVCAAVLAAGYDDGGAAGVERAADCGFAVFGSAGVSGDAGDRARPVDPEHIFVGMSGQVATARLMEGRCRIRRLSWGGWRRGGCLGCGLGMTRSICSF